MTPTDEPTVSFVREFETFGALLMGGSCVCA